MMSEARKCAVAQNNSEWWEEGCYPDFDRQFCWISPSLNRSHARECPFRICDHCKFEEHQVTRTCNGNGEWDNKANYNACITIIQKFPECVDLGCDLCPDVFREVVRSTTIALSVLSVVLLIISLILFTSFKSLRSRRLSIHENLAVAYVLRFSILTLWTYLQKHHVFYDCGPFRIELNPRLDLEWLCKTILWMTIYFQLASTYWMFVEGGYLISRFTVFAMRNSEGPFLVYAFVGWGVPLIAALVWSFLHESEQFCWIPFTQGNYILVLVVPMGLAVALNFLFLLAVIVILVQKLQADNLAESKMIWKTIKATLLLVPLLGVGNILLFYEPDLQESSEASRNAYMLISAILQHAQGIFVAVLYCFLNSEVQDAVKRHVRKLHCYQQYVRRFGYRSTELHTTTTTVETLDGSSRNQRRGIPNGAASTQYMNLSPAPSDRKRQANFLNQKTFNEEVQPLNIIRNPMSDDYV